MAKALLSEKQKDEAARKYSDGATVGDLLKHYAEYGYSKQGMLHVIKTRGVATRSRLFRRPIGDNEVDNDLGNFGTMLRMHRLRANLSQGQLAKRADMTASYISDLENGIRDPRYSTVRKIIHALDVDPRLFFADSAPDFPEEDRGPARGRRGARRRVVSVEPANPETGQIFAKLDCGHRMPIKPGADFAYCKQCPIPEDDRESSD